MRYLQAAVEHNVMNRKYKMSWENVASIATAVGVLVAAWQIRESRILASASYEDDYDKQYRELIYTIPVNALLGKELTSENRSQAREGIYNYLDLCNEQTYQRSQKRISKARWGEWSKGMKENLARPLFTEVWLEVKADSKNSFSFLEKLEREEFNTDPAKWKNS